MLNDVVVIGSGPAGVSAAWPLVRAGQAVLMIDASRGTLPPPPEGNYIDLRRRDTNQRDWMFGNDLASWIGNSAVSPKLRVPTLSDVFADFAVTNRIETNNFAAFGSLARGGLSNAWGCGVARYDSRDLASFPFSHTELADLFASVSRRIGISGAANDALSEYFGLDQWADVGPALDGNASALLGRYETSRDDKVFRALRLGRYRLALLSKELEDRHSCNLSGLCLWGCARGALYTAANEQPQLLKAGMRFRHGIVVDHLEKVETGWRICGFTRETGAPITIDAKRIIIAAGTLATTAIAWRSLRHYESEARLLSHPSCAFLLLRRAMPGRPAASGPAFAQVAFAYQLKSGDLAFGGLFSSTYIPAFEFIKHIPTSRSAARLIWRILAASTLVGNVFLPSKLTDHRVVLERGGVLNVIGRPLNELSPSIAEIASAWRVAAPKLGFLVMPGSFTPSQMGSDIHYAGTLPMRHAPKAGETSAVGELFGMPDVFIADAAAFPELPAKPHTLTMMAIADRLGRYLSSRALP